MLDFSELDASTRQKYVALSLICLVSAALAVIATARFDFAPRSFLGLLNGLTPLSSPEDIRCRHVFVDLGARSPSALHRLFNPTAFPGSAVADIFDEHFGRTLDERTDVCVFLSPPTQPVAEAIDVYLDRGFSIDIVDSHAIENITGSTRRVEGRHMVVSLGEDAAAIGRALDAGLLCSADLVLADPEANSATTDRVTSQLAAAGCLTRVTRIRDDSYRGYALGQAPPMSELAAPPLDTDGRPVRVGLCATLSQSEDPYLLEWVTFNFGLGVDVMLLVDNSEPGTAPLTDRVPQLRTCFGDSIVVVRDARKYQQLATYSRCAYAFSAMQDASWWIMAYDADEFLVLHPNVSVSDFVTDVVNRHGSMQVGAVVVNWYMMGSDDHGVTADDSPVTFRFQARQPRAFHLVKSIARARSVNSYETTHNANLKDGFVAIDPAGRVVTAFINQDPDEAAVDEAWMAHYWTKSLDEYRVSCVISESYLASQSPTVRSPHPLPRFASQCRPAG